ncbi:MAG TPA: PIN domain-containing protein [Bryobacteraceae bacterium]|nr:PIN domain-containing protein [Bryobacteraceae bacterium]
MSDLAFFDTNVLVYMHDPRYAHKREVALRLFRKHLYTKTLVISTQVLQEFYTIVSRKLENMQSGQAKAITEAYARLNVLTIQPDHILQAIGVESRYQISFWDSLILVGAKAAQAVLVLSEDMGHGQTYDGVRVENPFLTH